MSRIDEIAGKFDDIFEHSGAASRRASAVMIDTADLRCLLAIALAAEDMEHTLFIAKMYCPNGMAAWDRVNSALSAYTAARGDSREG